MVIDQLASAHFQAAFIQAFCLNAITLAVNCGDDSDTVASIVGTIVGAIHGAKAFPTSLVNTVKEVNNLKLKPLC
jgi:ADP-ribosylglycohydrolase